MLRGDDVVCGTSTTGTGTLTLAACPVPPGGVDFDVFLRATGVGFGNSAAVLVSYTLIEYTDTTFSTQKQIEKGVGTLTLGSSSGIVHCTLARTTLQTSATSLNSQPASQSILPGTGISIGTAANTLVFIGASAADTLALSPYQATSQSTTGFLPLMASATPTDGGMAVTNNQDWYMGFIWPYTTLVKSAFVRVESTYTGANNNIYGRLYAIGANGLPGKLLYDFGSFGTTNAAFGTAFAIIKAGGSGNGFILTPGEYYFNIFPSWTTGGTGTPQLTQWGVGPIVSNRMGMNGIQPISIYYANGGTSVAPDPAAGSSASGVVSSTTSPIFSLGAS